jgi:hypothetical protein
MKPIRAEFIDHAVNQFDPQRGQSENLSRMMDDVMQFTGPLSGRDQSLLEGDLNDELNRRRGMNFNFFDTES